MTRAFASTMIRSPLFDDIYFTDGDAPAEVQHVFLMGNDLPGAWQAREGDFCICETGFGTGLNFLMTWAAFEEHARPAARLDYVSVEMYPLAPAQIKEALSSWTALFGGRLDLLLASYPLRVPGFHRISLTPRVSLTLIFDDVNIALPQVEAPRGIDAWFLDGFAPAKNPGMWSDILFREMARLSTPGATVATFTAAGAVKRGLLSAGFSVEKVTGFGRKRDMLRGKYVAGHERQSLKCTGTRRVAVIGGGLAGTACAYALRGHGILPVIFDAADRMAAGASGNKRGLFNPRFSAQRTAESDFYTAGYAQAARVFSNSFPGNEIGLHRCGSLHLINSEEKRTRFPATKENWSWHEDHMQIHGPGQAGDRAGIDVSTDALFLPDSGFVDPAALCRAYGDRVETRLNTPAISLDLEGSAWRVNDEIFDSVILACGMGVKACAPTSWLPVQAVRGQMGFAPSTVLSASLKVNICYGGYMTPAHDGIHALGATFQKDRVDTEVHREDEEEILKNLAANMPNLCDGVVMIDHRAAVRCAAQDRFPIVGPVPDIDAVRAGQDKVLPGLYVTTAHGSHGIVSSLAAGFYLADAIGGTPHSLARSTIQALDPKRFIERTRRRGRAF